MNDDTRIASDHNSHMTTRRLRTDGEQKCSDARVSVVAIIGSFRKRYDLVLAAAQRFQISGLEVASPKGERVIDPNVDFVRFATDPEHCDDPEIQTAALFKIFSADFVYVVAPEGYVGKTTCYEIGRLIERRHPLYFSEPPKDLPIRVHSDHVWTVEDLCDALVHDSFSPKPLYGGWEDDHSRSEHLLVRSGTRR